MPAISQIFDLDFGGTPWPNANPKKWNTVKLNDYVLPGIAKVSVKVSQELDKKKARGSAGATITQQGSNAAEVSISLRFFEEQHLKDFARIVQSIRIDATKTGLGKAYRITHPKAAMYGITSVIIEEIDDEENSKGDSYDVKIKCVEFKPPVAGATKTEKKLAPRNVIGVDLKSGIGDATALTPLDAGGKPLFFP
jgi:hypothetical protein